MSFDDKPVELKPGEGVIRCPAVRSLIKSGELKHEDLQTAAVHDLVRVLSGRDRILASTEPGSLANVAGFFAVLNHGVSEHGRGDRGGLIDRIRHLFQKGRDLRDAAAIVSGNATDRLFDLRFLGSDGDHPGTVNFFKNDDTGVFQTGQFKSVMAEVSDGVVLTIEGIARMIIVANDGTWDKKGSTLDLVKSSGEWALMVCALRLDRESMNMSVTDLHQMYSQADSTRLLLGTGRATAQEWVKVTAQIVDAIAKQKDQESTVLGSLHSVFGDFNDLSGETLCPCMTCNPGIWATLR